MKTKSKNQKPGLKSRPEQLSTELPKLDLALRHRNRQLPTQKVLSLLENETPRFWELAEVVGKWIWIQFSEKQPREITAALSQLGFHWNNRRQTWQHPCGVFRDESAMIDPRRIYPSYFVADIA